MDITTIFHYLIFSNCDCQILVQNVLREEIERFQPLWNVEISTMYDGNGCSGPVSGLLVKGSSNKPRLTM